MAFFNKTKREEKKRLQKEAKAHLEQAKGLGEQIEQARAAQKEKEPLLKKELQVTATAPKGALYSGLAKTKRFFKNSIFSLANIEKADEDFLEELEERLFTADLGAATCMRVMGLVREALELGEIQSQEEVIASLQAKITEILAKGDPQLPQATTGPTVYLFVGVNGVGKTTTIGKLAAQLKGEGKKVLAAAGDTFRAAAIEQLAHWCKQVDIPLVQRELNSDPAAVLYEACERAKKEGFDVLLCDTSGRLHTKSHLMEELKKMKRSIQKVLPTAPHASILVLDANTGQNAILQTKEFSEVVDLDGLIVTKLDGTAKGGVIIGIVNEFDLPIYYIGVGEGVEHLQHFSATGFAAGLFAD